MTFVPHCKSFTYNACEKRINARIKQEEYHFQCLEIALCALNDLSDAIFIHSCSTSPFSICGSWKGLHVVRVSRRVPHDYAERYHQNRHRLVLRTRRTALVTFRFPTEIVSHVRKDTNKIAVADARKILFISLEPPDLKSQPQLNVPVLEKIVRERKLRKKIKKIKQ